MLILSNLKVFTFSHHLTFTDVCVCGVFASIFILFDMSLMMMVSSDSYQSLGVAVMGIQHEEEGAEYTTLRDFGVEYKS